MISPLFYTDVFVSFLNLGSAAVLSKSMSCCCIFNGGSLSNERSVTFVESSYWLYRLVTLSIIEEWLGVYAGAARAVTLLSSVHLLD
jgi:hypothetical protein